MSKDQSVDHSIELTEDEKQQLADRGFLVVCDERNNTGDDHERHQTNVSLLVHPNSPLHPDFRLRFQDFLSDLCERVDNHMGHSNQTPEDYFRNHCNPPGDDE